MVNVGGKYYLCSYVSLFQSLLSEVRGTFGALKMIESLLLPCSLTAVVLECQIVWKVVCHVGYTQTQDFCNSYHCSVYHALKQLSISVLSPIASEF